jgi:hypothetical protein
MRNFLPYLGRLDEGTALEVVRPLGAKANAPAFTR